MIAYLFCGVLDVRKPALSNMAGEAVDIVYVQLGCEVFVLEGAQEPKKDRVSIFC